MDLMEKYKDKMVYQVPENLVLIERRELDRLRRLAETDELTGLPNAKAIRDYVERNPGGWWVMVDLDGFKAFQDSNGGHAAGDQVLKEFSQFLLKNTRQNADLWTNRNSDLVAARLHGDEFAVYVVSDNPVTGSRRIARLTRQWHFKSVTASAGYGQSEEKADRMLYRFKNSRR